MKISNFKFQISNCLLVTLLTLLPLRTLNAASPLITATLTVTNGTQSGQGYTVNGSFRYGTNAISGTTWVTNTQNATATNIWTQLTLNPITGVIPSFSSTNVITFKGQNLTASLTSNVWATLTLATNLATNWYALMLPFDNAQPTNRTNNASQLVYGEDLYSTNLFRTNCQALSNYVTIGVSYAGGVQAIPSPKNFASLSGYLLNVTNGIRWGGTNASPILSNSVNYGNALRSEGNGASSLQVGSNALASSIRSVAIGVNALATNTDSAAFGTGAQATNTTSLAIGNASLAGGSGSIAIGPAAQAVGANSISIGSSSAAGNGAILIGNIDNAAAYDYGIGIGFGAQANKTNALAIGYYAVGTSNSTTALGDLAWAKHDHSTALGASSLTTASHQVRLGTASETVSIPGPLAVESSITNSTFTGTNNWNGDIAFQPRSNSSPANGNNAGVILGTNVNIEISGPTTIATYCGFAAERSGSFHIVELGGALTNIIANQSGTDPTAANRIITGTGADVTLTNQPAFIMLKYNAATSRWKLLNWTR